MTQKKLGRYDLIRVLGKGAMGLVYEGRDPNLERRVAIKTIKVENLSDEAAAEYEARFRTEARSAARLQHPNIVSVYDSDRDGDIAFLVMEFIEGEDLKHHLDRGKRHTFEQTLAIMADLLSALDYAHRARIVHRDIKPANLLIEASGRVKLTDFGVARIQDSGDATRTQGSMVGTLKYMSPEQVQGLPVDSRTDLFAAGVLLYQLLTGQRPFDGDSDFVIIQRIVAQDPAAPTSINPALPPAIDAVVARALAKSRDQRYTTAQEFATALQACAGQGFDATAVAPPPSGFGRASTWTGTVRAGESLVDTQSGIEAGTSVVAQELELVYWKDIKDSSDIEDLQGFLIKFPSGIYADLARRRLGKLGGATGDGSTGGTRTDSALRADPGAAEKTEVPLGGGQTARMGIAPAAPSGAAAADAPARPGVDTAWDALMQAGGTGPAEMAQYSARRPPVSTASAIAARSIGEVSAGGASAPADNTTPTLSPRRMVWILAGVVVLAGTAFGVRIWSESDTPAEPPAALANSTAAPATVPASTIGAGSTPVAPPTATVATTTQSAEGPATPARSTAWTVPSASSSPVTAASSGTRKGAPDRERLAKTAVVPAPIGANTTATTATTATATTAATTTSTGPASVSAHPGRSTPAPVAQAVPAPAPAANASPRQACGDRYFISFQSCMSDQCAKPAFTNHPICVERRAMDQSRREAEQSR